MDWRDLPFPLTEAEIQLLAQTEKWSFGDRFSAADPAICETDAAPRMEAHPFREILFALRGSYNYFFQDRPVRCVPGTVLFIDNGVSHEYLYRKPESELLHIWMHLHTKDRLIIRLVHIDPQGKASGLPLCSLPQIQGRLWDYWDRLSQCGDEESRDNIRRYLKYALALIFDAARHTAKTQTQAQVAVEYAATALDNPCSEVSIDALAAQTGYSRFHFSRLFKKEYGISPYEYRQMRCWDYYREMRSRHYPNKEIASELGFANVSAFYRWVKSAKRRYA